MKNKNDELVLFQESFDTAKEALPGLWQVESNSDLPHIPAIRYGENCIEFISAGNKYLPVIPEVSDFTLETSFRIKYRSSGSFGVLICFHYDSFTSTGKYIGIHNFRHTSGQVTIEYGTTQANEFFPEKQKSIEIPTDEYDGPLSVKMTVQKTRLTLSFMSRKCSFVIPAGHGSIAFARTHFFGILRLTGLAITGCGAEKRKLILQKTIPLPSCQTHYPIFCDVTLHEQGNCMEGDLTFHGGTPDYPAGEGDYHGMRANILEEPFFKIITADHVDSHILCNDPIVLVPDGLAPAYFFDELHKKMPWPFTRKVRFFKPATDYDLAVGFGSYLENFSQNLALTPAETQFSTAGKIIYSGLGLTDGKTVKTEFLSQEKKKILSLIPKSDPRYDKAIRFAKRNHYFFEDETPAFVIRITSKSAVPASFEILLEDAFFNPVRTLKFRSAEKTVSYGVLSCRCTELTVEKLKKLPIGVWHIRVRSNDPSTAQLEQHCAFEIMGNRKDAPTPQEASGLPFLYNARTETRGLMTDPFDPYIGESVNEGHYVSCSVFLPEAFRKYKIAPTLKAYGRKNFSWISTRTLNDPSWEANLDIIRESDYINFCFDCNSEWHGYATAVGSYKGARFRNFINFLKSLKDPAFDIPALEKAYKNGDGLDLETYTKMAEKYWEEWLDEYNRLAAENIKKLWLKVRKVNPTAMLSMYGPFAIYASACKGPDAVRLLGNSLMSPDHIGFWQFEDYPVACGYPIERGAFMHTAAIMAMKGSRIYPEIYSINKLKRGCPDGAVFYAHPPFGDVSDAYDPTGKLMMRQILNFVYDSAHICDGRISYWTQTGFQTCNFPEIWYTNLMKVWGLIRKNPPLAPLRSIAYVAPGGSKKKNHSPHVYDQNGRMLVRKTSLEDVPYLFEEATAAGVCNGFQLFEEDILTLTKDKVSTLLLPPLKGMKKAIINKIRSLHNDGVNIMTFEDASGLEDLFGIKDTKKSKTISCVTAVGEYCTGMTEYCDDRRCTGRYKNVNAEVLLDAKIPVLTRKKNGNAYAVFFNVPPHFIKENRLHARGSHGKVGISPLISKVCGEVMRSLAPAAVSISQGRLLACHTQNNKLLLIVSNPDQEKDIVTEITINRKDDFIPYFDSQPECNREVMQLKADRDSRTCRVFLPANEFLTMVFPAK